MKHDMNLTASARAIIAAGQHLRQKDAGDRIEILSRKLADMADASIKRMAQTEEKVNELNGQLIELAQKSARMGGSFGGFRDEPTTWGQQFVHADGLKSFSEETSRPGRFRMDVKAITNDAASAGAMGVPTRDGLAPLPRRRMTIRELLPAVEVSTNLVEFIAQLTRPNNAATVPEGAPKPESDMALAMRTVPTQVIAHWIAASRQVLDDLPQLRDLIDGELRYGLMEVEEAQILNGNGVGANLHGLIPNATAFADPLALTDPTQIDILGAAILQNALADFPADGIVVHPSDWMRMRMLKDADGKYILGAPGAAVDPVLFGLPVVATKAIAAGSFLVGNFQMAATVYDRWQARVEVSSHHADFFTSNKVAILAEERLGLAVKQPKALTHGEFA